MKGRIVVKSRKSDTHGYLKFRYKNESGNEKVESLNIRIPNKNHFDPKTQRIKTWQSIPYHNEINNQIEEFLEKKRSKQPTNSEELSLVNYIREKIVIEFHNQSTRRTYLHTANNIERFIKSEYNADDVNISDIDKDFATGFKNYLITSSANDNQNNRRLSRNTCHCYFNRFKSVLSKIQNNTNTIYNQTIFKITIDPTPSIQKGILDNKEIKELIYGHITNSRQRKYILTNIRNMFLFQILCDGIRISDLITIRLNNLLLNNDDIIINKTYIKTNKPHRIKITNKMFAYITPFIVQIIKDYNMFPNDILATAQLTFILKKVEKLREERAKLKSNLSIYFTLKDEIESKISLIEDEIDSQLQELSESTKLKIKKVIESNHDKDIFIFPYLSNEYFKGIDDFSILSDKQYYTLMDKRIIYNRHLNKIMKLININNKITSHSARHTFASLIVGSGDYDVYELSKALEHSNIRITDNYIHSLENSRESLNSRLDELF